MTQYIKSYNIANNSIKSFAFDSSVANTFNAASVVSAVAISANVAAQAVSTFVTLQTQSIAALPPSINVVSITDSSYNVIDEIRSANTGDYLQITGSNFQSGVIAVFGLSNTATSTSLVDSNTLRVQTPNIAVGTYPIYVVNSNGGTGIRINGLTTERRYNIFGFGRNVGSFGINEGNISRSSPVQIGSKVNWTTTYGDINPHGIYLKSNGALWALGGNNNSGSLGLNDRITKSSPVQIGSDKNWSSIEIGYLCSFATKTDGTLWAWGYNGMGQLGLSDKVNRSSPVQVGADTNWSKTCSMGYSTFAIKTNGTLWAWGSDYGHLGLNLSLAGYRSSPVQVGVLTNWSKLVQGGSNTGSAVAALKTDGTLWLWGEGSEGQLGQNNLIARSSPVQLGTDTNWNTISNSKGTFLATKTNGTLWAWGSNSNTQLGLNLGITSHRSSPTQVGADTTWLSAYTSYESAIALKSNGTLWTWGTNSNGQLGFNDVVNRSSPVQVGTNTDWGIIYPSLGWGFYAGRNV